MALKMFSSPRCDTAYDVQFILQIVFFFLFLSVTYFNCCYYSLQLLMSSKNFCMRYFKGNLLI